MMTTESMDKQRGSSNSPPSHAVVILRRETYRGLLKAADFFRSIRDETEDDISDIADELLVAFAMSREEAVGGGPNA